MQDGRRNVEADARHVVEVLAGGGIGILPMDVGYSLIASQGAALERIFIAKQRAATKYNAMIGDAETSRSLHVMTDRQRAMVEAITLDQGLPFGVIAPARMDHPLISSLDAQALKRSVYRETVCMLLNAGPFHAALSRLSREAGLPLFGSSANRTMQGTKFRVEDIEPEIRSIADVVVDYGLRKFYHYAASSTLIDIVSMEVVRVGSCYDLIRDTLARQFGVALPEHAHPLAPAAMA